MPFSGVVDPDQLKMLTSILDEYCETRNIAGEQERNRVAVRILALFKDGAQNHDAIRAALLLADPGLPAESGFVSGADMGLATPATGRAFTR